jgi:hypothetical protein
MRMKHIDPFDVRLITLNGRMLTLILRDDGIIRLKYSSEKDAALDLKHWQAAHFMTGH